MGRRERPARVARGRDGRFWARAHRRAVRNAPTFLPTPCPAPRLAAPWNAVKADLNRTKPLPDPRKPGRAGWWRPGPTAESGAPPPTWARAKPKKKILTPFPPYPQRPTHLAPAPGHGGHARPGRLHGDARAHVARLGRGFLGDEAQEDVLGADLGGGREGGRRLSADFETKKKEKKTRAGGRRCVVSGSGPAPALAGRPAARPRHQRGIH